MRETMEYELFLNRSPREAKPDGSRIPFSHVWQENRPAGTAGNPAAAAVGIRCGGYFRFSGTDREEQALAALRYGLESAFFSLAGEAETADASLFTDQSGELLSEINRILEKADSPVRLEALEFFQADRYVRPQNPGAGRYSGFIIGSGGTRQVTLHAPLGIEGEWQCVCGVYNAPRKRKCAECRIARPLWKL